MSKSAGTRLTRNGTRKITGPASAPYRPSLLAWLQDSRNAAAYCEAALDDGHVPDLLHALRDIANAHGGIAQIAERTGLNRAAFYRTVSKRGNPELKSVAAILDAAGLRLGVVPRVLIVRKAS